MSKLRKAIVVGALLAAAAVAPGTVRAAVVGDANGDGKTDLADAVMVLRMSVGLVKPTPEQIASADVIPILGWGQPPGDGNVKVTDAVRIMQFAVGQISSAEFANIPNATYIGDKECGTCHQDTHQDWTGTVHAKALEVLRNYPGKDMSTNAACLGCHTVGFGKPSGYVDEKTTGHLAGVQCESCHGPGSEHAANDGDKTKILTADKAISARVCGNCHRGAHNPFYEEWSSSPHGHVVEHVAEYFAEDKNVTTCAPCHSGDYRVLVNYMGRPAPKGPDLKYSQTCSVCHNPHRATGNAVEEEGEDMQIRFPLQSLDPTQPNLCGQCHRKRDDDSPAKDSRPPHHSPQFSFLIGDGGATGGPDVLRSSHATVKDQCAHCHMYATGFQDADHPAVVGHTFKPNLNACEPCHTAEKAEEKVQATQSEIKASLAALKTRLDRWGNWEYVSNKGPAAADQANIPAEVKEARYNYYYITNEGSFGVHNAKYARALLLYANVRLDALKVP